MSIVTDLSTNKDWKLRQGDDNEFTISFVDSLAAIFDVSSYVFSLNITSFNNKSVNVLQLTEGSGIVNGGATGVVTFTVTDAQSALLENSYYYEIDAVLPDATNHVLFQGKAIVNDFEYTGSSSTSTTATLNLSGSNITATISLSGSVVVEETLVRFKSVDEVYEISSISDFQVATKTDGSGVTSSLTLSDGTTAYTLSDTVTADDYLILSVNAVGNVQIKVLNV